MSSCSAWKVGLCSTTALCGFHSGAEQMRTSVPCRTMTFEHTPSSAGKGTLTIKRYFPPTFCSLLSLTQSHPAPRLSGLRGLGRATLVSHGTLHGTYSRNIDRRSIRFTVI